MGHKARELSCRASAKVLEAAGILNTPNASPTIVNIVQQNNIFADPYIRQIAERFGSFTAPLEIEKIDYYAEDGA